MALVGRTEPLGSQPGFISLGYYASTACTVVLFVTTTKCSTVSHHHSIMLSQSLWRIKPYLTKHGSLLEGRLPMSITYSERQHGSPAINPRLRPGVYFFAFHNLGED